MVTIRKGASGPHVKEMQSHLKALGYDVQVDGFFGPATEMEVKKFQSANGLAVDGIVGPNTFRLLKTAALPKSKVSTLDCVDSFVQLRSNKFVDQTTAKVGLTVHHTVSDGNPNKVVDVFNKGRRGAVSTPFIIGRTLLNGDDTWDGHILQCFDYKKWAYHVAATRTGKSRKVNNIINQHYIGIELCSYGCLKVYNGKFITHTHSDPSKCFVIPNDQVIELELPNRTYKYWHKYTDRQIEKLYLLMKELQSVYGWDYNRGYPEPITRRFFEDVHFDALLVRQTLTIHNSFELGKFDAYADPRLIDMFNSLK